MIRNGLYVLDYDGDYSEDDITEFWNKESKNGLHEFLYDKIIEAAQKNLTEIPVFKYSYGGIVKIKHDYLDTYIPYAINYFEIKEEYERCSVLVEMLNTIKGNQ